MSIVGYFSLTAIQVIIIGYIQVKINTDGFGYDFSITDSFNLSISSTIVLVVAPLLLSYSIIVAKVRRSKGTVEIIGPNSLLQSVNLEKLRVLKEDDEFTEEHLQNYLNSMVENEPEGALDNLQMLLKSALITEEVINDNNARSVKRVYVADNELPNAYTFRVIPIPLVGSDWIVINRSIIDLLGEDELRAVLTHEIGHVKSRDSWLSLFYYSPRLVGIIITAMLLAEMAGPLLGKPISGSILLNTTIIFMVIFIYQVFVRITYALTRYSYYMSELLADIYAGNHIEPIHLANALFRIHKKSLVFEAMQKELEWYQEKHTQLTSTPIFHELQVIMSSNELSLTFSLMRIHGIIQNYLAKSDVEYDRVEDMDQLVRNRLNEYRIMGPEPPHDLRDRVIFEREAVMDKNQFHEMIAKIENDERFVTRRDAHPSIVERLNLISELLNEH